MILILSSVFIGEDRNRPALTVTDKSYGRTDHFKHIHTDAELHMMAPHERAVAVEFDKEHKNLVWSRISLLHQSKFVN
jgi:hypothetical protein